MYLQLSGVMWLSVKRECIANNTRNEGLVSKCLNCSCTMHVVPLPTKWCLTLPVFFSLQSFVLHAHRKPTGGSLPRHIPFSDSAYPHCVSDPLPQSFVGSSYNWTALNHDSERSSRVPYSEQAMLAHLGLEKKGPSHEAPSTAEVDFTSVVDSMRQDFPCLPWCS
jgi:hypothetical protein